MKKIIKSRKFKAILIIILAIIGECITAIIFNLRNENESFIETLYFSSQIVSSFFVISGVVIAVWQYYLSCKNARTDLEISQVQRAIDLSEYYKDNILNYIPAIVYVFDNSGATQVLDKIQSREMKDFNTIELNRLFTPGDIEKLKNIQESEPFHTAILEANEIYNLNLNIRAISAIEKTKEISGQKKTILEIKRTSISDTFMSDLINRVLNNMEFFALHFKHNTADDTVVYQSLHQSYIVSMKYLYYYIADANENPTAKFYTNVIWLYEKWSERKEVQDTKHAKGLKEISFDGTIVQKKNSQKSKNLLLFFEKKKKREKKNNVLTNHFEYHSINIRMGLSSSEGGKEMGLGKPTVF